MAGRKQTKGTCTYCHKEFGKAAATRHLTTCAQRQEAIALAETSTEKKKPAPEMLYHLRVHDAYSKDFWLDLEMRGSKTLKDLDNYLRGIWLECCGHMSQFSLGSRLAQQIGMQRKISDVFQRGSELNHIYDFGTSSETVVKLVAVSEGTPLTSKPIALMFRNLMPEVTSDRCEQLATHLCLECQYEDNLPGFLCDRHTKGHPNDNYGKPNPLVNSPRMGMCGYDAPAEPPY